jgi:hypothetical protein
MQEVLVYDGVTTSAFDALDRQKLSFQSCYIHVLMVCGRNPFNVILY